MLPGENLFNLDCAKMIEAGLNEWAEELRRSTPTYLDVTITQLSPADACAGETLTITGTGFGDGTLCAVSFTGDGHLVALSEDADVVSWAPDRIEVRVPARARRGPVGVVELPVMARQNVHPAAYLVGLGNCFGPNVVPMIDRHLRQLGNIIPEPGTQADGANLFTGGLPSIQRFWAAPSARLWPTRRIELHYQVDGATHVEIVPRDVGGRTNELPPINAALAPDAGTVAVSPPGTRPWRGAYVLRAFNRCTGNEPVERLIELEMVIRDGLALGGGGTRGDFQVGALRYIYDEMGFRPNAIASTSVGSVNAALLVQGDSAAGNAAVQLENFWVTLLHTEADIWGEEPWLRDLKKTIREAIRLLSFQGLMMLPYTIGRAIQAPDEVKGLLRAAQALFNLHPIERKLGEHFDPQRATDSGIELRVISVSVETGGLVMVSEAGRVLPTAVNPVRPYGFHRLRRPA